MNEIRLAFFGQPESAFEPMAPESVLKPIMRFACGASPRRRIERTSSKTYHLWVAFLLLHRLRLHQSNGCDGDFENALASFPMPDLANVKYAHTVERKESKHSSTYDSMISESEDSDFETALNQAITSQPDLFP